MALFIRSSLSQLRSLTRLSNQMVLPSRSYSAMSFTFASPYEVHYKDADVKQIDVPSFSGTFGILPQHVPTLAVLKPGVVTVFENDGNSKKYFVSSGTVTINEDSSVQILAEEAVPLDLLDANAARDALKDAQLEESKATSPEDKAAAQVAIEVSEAIIKAVE
ncbi:ATP synthase subunit delta, mitochondrial-like [Panonychus citri]|uniref:ATP synthase subunit delta, mitochondrial-like n=1 Tax=Panonychus citri TaxID=50023 RepID=UPI002306DE5A|nr:ATP synthase subunit delta, mitochondrial-like [Panonychus citri]